MDLADGEQAQLVTPVGLEGFTTHCHNQVLLTPCDVPSKMYSFQQFIIVQSRSRLHLAASPKAPVKTLNVLRESSNLFWF